jgi:hypothetical protein
MDANRRQLLEKALFGAGMAGLRALATGLPAAAFVRPLSAVAQEAAACANKAKAQYLILSATDAGEPLNANAPGTYDSPAVVHAPDPAMAPTPIKLGAQDTTAAQLWSTLPQWALDRACFFHHGTYTNNHGNLGKVLKLMGAAARGEMLPSLVSKELAPCLGTIQVEPVQVSNLRLTFNGRVLPSFSPTNLRTVLARPTGTLANLAPLRDQAIDRLYAYAKDQGNPEQRAFIDSLAISRRQTKALSDDLLNMLSVIKDDGESGQIQAAVGLIRMNVAPVVGLQLRFGGDNHGDPGLKTEVTQHTSGVGQIVQLMQLLQQFGLQDRVTFASFGVFGRSLKKQGLGGRDHFGDHHVTLMIGKGLRGSVIGGIQPNGSDFRATPIDAKTGRAAPGAGDVPFADTLGAMAKTMGVALGVSRTAMEANVASGKIIDPALS